MKLTVDQETAPISVADFLRIAGLSLTLRRKIKKSGQIIVNGKPATWINILKPGDIVEISLVYEDTLPPIPMDLEIVYEDDYLLVINKPAGILVHPTSDIGRPSIANAVISYYRKKNLNRHFHPVHRLDRNTSGLLLIAKHPHIQNMLVSHQGEIKLKRLYIAVISGQLEHETQIIDAPIGRHPHSIIQRVVRSDGQPAVTFVRSLEKYPNAEAVEAELQTGRTHQIRVHLSHIGHPIHGDDLYGGPTHLMTRPALHAAKMKFKHPITNEFIELESPLPEDMEKLIRKLRE